MANEVFVNDLEVACKAADGVSSVAINPCMITLCPPPAPVIIPLLNTAHAKNTTKGSKTVFISRKEVILKDKSYIKSSEGDDAAKCKKGIITGAKNGKAYFRSWSMNVKIEGYNVCRHTDKITHNHGSEPGNTGAWVYLDDAALKDNCQKEKDKMDTACGISDDEQENYQKKKKRINDRKIAKGKKPYKKRDKTWKDKHCMGHLIAPGSVEGIDKKLKDIEKGMKEYIEDIKDDIPSSVADKAIDDALSIDSALSCSRLRFPWLIAACKIGTIAYAGYEGAKGILDVIESIEKVKDQAKTVKKLKEELDTYSEGMKSKEEIQKEIDQNKGQKDLANAQDKMAEAEPCLKARKCMLVPYKRQAEEDKDKNKRLKDNKPTGKGKQDFLGKSPFELKNKYGCCPGQTGHHLLPTAWAKSTCPNYKESKAPVVCAEGTSHSNGGSHDRLHTSLDKGLDTYVRGGPKREGVTFKVTIEKETTTKNLNRLGKTYSKVKDALLTKDEAITLAADSHAETFPNSKCSPKCIKAQLEDFYKNCKDNFNGKSLAGGVEVSDNTSGLDD